MLSLVGVVPLLLDLRPAFVVLVLVGIIGAIVSAKSNRGPVAAFCAVQVLGSLLLGAGILDLGPLAHHLGFSLEVAVALTVVLPLFVGAIGVIVCGTRAKAAPRTAIAAAPPQPAGYTADGRPFYPIVGYTPEGTPITADQAPGYRPPSSGTNSKAITAFILAFTFAILAIPFGHMARSEIRRTGEGGGGLALAALIIGYIHVGILIAIGIAVAVILAKG